MFTEFENQVWTVSDGTVVVTNNTDTSIDGSSKKLTWTATSEAYVTLTFDEVDLSLWEEISLHLYAPSSSGLANIFKITIDGTDFNFTRENFRPSKWTHIVIDCSSMGAVTTITFTCLAENLTMFVDYLGVRKVSFDCDTDVIEALKDHITLDYDVSTTLSADVDASEDTINLASIAYISDSSILELDDGAGTVETVEVINRSGSLSVDLKDELTNAFSAGDEVRVICPVRSEDYNELEPDPVCGIKVFDITPERREDVEILKNGVKIKEYLGTLGLLVYIDCCFKKKLLQLAREYIQKYGYEFEFLLDGESVPMYLESSTFTDDILGNNPRVAFFYRFEPQPYLLVSGIVRSTETITVDSVGVTEIGW